jgi:hypothetical protein
VHGRVVFSDPMPLLAGHDARFKDAVFMDADFTPRE